MANVYFHVATAIGEGHPQFRRWLNDMSGRPAPFMDFDVRGLPPECRPELYRAARVARDRLAADLAGKGAGSPILDALDVLVRMGESMDRQEPPLTLSDDDQVREYDGFVVDMREIWGE